MSRTFKDKPYTARNRDKFPYGLRTRWNNCPIHGKLCSHGASYNKRRVLERKEVLQCTD